MNTPRLPYQGLIDVSKLQALLENLHQVIGIANAVIDTDGVIIAQSGWQDACARFHRVNQETCLRCIESDTSLVESMARGVPYVIYQCPNGLIDAAAPIVVDGEHAASVFTGQFLTASPDTDFFLQQARKFGFPEDQYLEAISKLPIVPPDRAEAITRLYAQIAGMLADSGMNRLNQQHAQNTIEKSRLLLDATQKLAHVGGWEWDIEQQTMTWTDEVYQIHGMRPDERFTDPSEYIARSLACYDPVDRPVIEVAFRRCVEEGIAYDMELPLCRVDQRRIWIRTTADAFKQDNRIVKVFGTLQDITTRKRLEMLRDDSVTKFRTMLDSLEGAVYVADMHNYEILYVNEVIKNLVGDVVGRICWQVLQSGQEGPCDFCTNTRLVQEDGSPAEAVIWEHFNKALGRWFHCRDKAISWPDGRLVRIETATDITAPKEAKERQHRDAEKIQMALAGADLGIWESNLQTRLASYDQRWCAMVGYSVEEMTQTIDGWLALMHPEDRIRVQADFQRNFEDHIDQYESEFRLRHKAGQWIWIYSRGKIFRDSTGMPTYAAGTHLEITDRKRLKNEGASLLRQIGELIHSFREHPGVGKSDTPSLPHTATKQRLSKRQLEVLKLIANGMSSAKIAEHLGISRETVVGHRRDLMRKIGAHNTADVTRYALENRLANTPPREQGGKTPT